jgi:hypothetical protein
MLCLLFAFLTLISQSPKEQGLSGGVLYRMEPREINRYEPYKHGLSVLLKNEFAGSLITNREELKKLKGKHIISVDLYYSRYRANEKFEQPLLNKERFDTLIKYLPRITRGFVMFNAFEQTEAKTEASAKKLFHGFVIQYLEPPTLSSSSAELAMLDKFLSLDSLGHFENVVEEKTRIKKEVVKTGYDPILKKYRNKKIIRETSGGILSRKPHADTLITEVKLKPKIVGRRYVPPSYVWGMDPSAMGTAMFKMVAERFDSTFFYFMKKHKPAEKTLFVVDATGSMLPYNIQICMWNRLMFNPKNPARYAVFNDGDRKPDDKKVNGKVEGVYVFSADSAVVFEKYLRLVMQKGFGGDLPENNLEAVLKGLKKFPDSPRVLMVADCHSGVRDMELLSKIKIPVDILLCGTRSYVHPNYLNIARATGGNLYAIDTEITGLKQVKEGSTLLFGKARFLLRNGNFVPVY